MSDSMLKKEFNRQDVQRIRNIVTKKFNDRTKTSAGYVKEQVIHNEGDVWEEDGKKWTIKDGIKQNITVLDKAKEFVKMPLTCPTCKKSMKHRNDKKMYKIHGFCFDCTINFEHDLRQIGKYEDYARAMVTGNMKVFAIDLENAVIDMLEEGVGSFVTEQGDIEDWGHANKTPQLELLKRVKEYREQVEGL